MVEQFPAGIFYFFAIALFVAAVVTFYSAGEGVRTWSVALSVAFIVLGGAFVWVGIVQNSLIPLP